MSLISRYPASIASVALLALLTAFFWATGALWPEQLPAYATSSRQIIGMALMLIVMPPYLVMAGIVGQRRSLELVAQIGPQLPGARYAEEAAGAIRGALARTWVAGAAVGFLIGLLNIQPPHALLESATPAMDISLAAGQLLLWLMVGLLIGVRFVSAQTFSRLGDAVEFDLFRLDRLRPLARLGAIDVLVVAGGLAISPLQALDAEFRWENYRSALLVALPAAAFLLLWPLRALHRRIREAKRRQMARIDGLIEAQPRSESADSVSRLEVLLAHRDRLREVRTWPLSNALLTRVLFYLVIPPLAWVGAAVVEMLVDRTIAG